MTYAVVDLRARTMTYARAGHTPLIHVPGAEPRRAARSILAPDGMVRRPEARRRRDVRAAAGGGRRSRCSAGDLFVFFTDGISEAMNGADDCFGEVRLGRLVEDHADLPPEELRERVLREVAAFVGGAPQHDDMTMILLRVEELPMPPCDDRRRARRARGED